MSLSVFLEIFIFSSHLIDRCFILDLLDTSRKSKTCQSLVYLIFISPVYVCGGINRKHPIFGYTPKSLFSIRNFYDFQILMHVISYVFYHHT